MSQSRYSKVTDAVIAAGKMFAYTITLAVWLFCLNILGEAIFASQIRMKTTVFMSIVATAALILIPLCTSKLAPLWRGSPEVWEYGGCCPLHDTYYIKTGYKIAYTTLAGIVVLMACIWLTGTWRGNLHYPIIAAIYMRVMARDSD